MCPNIPLFSPTFAVTDSLMMGNSEPFRAPKLQDNTDMADVKDITFSTFKIPKTYIQDNDCLRVLKNDFFRCLAFKFTFLEIGQGIPWRSTVCFEIMNRLWSAAFTADGCVESLPTEKRALWDNFFCQMRFFFLKGPQTIGRASRPSQKMQCLNERVTF